MTELNKTYGYKYHDGTGLDDELLASDQYQMISITIDTAARDADNVGYETTLRRGLVLVLSSGKYTIAPDATLNATAVVLAETVPGIDAGDVVAKAYYKATFKTGKVLDPGGYMDFAECPRLSVRDNA